MLLLRRSRVRKILVCKALVEDDRVVVLSPTIGRAILTVKKGQIVSPGQLIGSIWRLDQRFLLKLSDECSGTIASLPSRDRVQPLAYGQCMLELEQTVARTTTKKREEQQANDSNNSVHAPMDGMFYLAPSPKDPPYVQVGDTIAPGQTIGLIEVMKCFYPLKYSGTASAKVVDIKVSSASPVSSGATLMVIAEK